MIERRLFGGESICEGQLDEVIKTLGPSSTSNQEKFDAIVLERIKDPGDFTHEVAMSFIYMLNDTSKYNKEPKIDKNMNNDFSAVIRARWNEMSNTESDEHLLVQDLKEDVRSSWNSAIFVEGVNKAINLLQQRVENVDVNWEKILDKIISSSNLLDLSENDGSFELFCSLLGECYRKDERRQYDPKENELYCKIDPFLKTWENPNIQALFLIRISRMSFEINHRSYNLQQRNDKNDSLEDSLIENNISFDALYTDMSNYSIIIDVSSHIPDSLISLFKTDKSLAELIEDGILGVSCNYTTESKLPKIGLVNTKGSCGVFLCNRLLKALFDLNEKITDKRLSDQIQSLIFYEIPKYSPIGMLSSLGAIYDDITPVNSISNELVNKISESFELSLTNNAVSKLILIKMAIDSTQDFISLPRSKIVSTSHDKEYDLGPRFGLILQIIFASFEKTTNNKNSQFIRDFISQIAFCYRISSILFISRLTVSARNYLWKFLYSEWKILPHFYKMDVANHICPILLKSDFENSKQISYSIGDSIDYFHWWFLCIDLIFSGISICKNFELGLPDGECEDISRESTNVLITLFNQELGGEDVESLLFVTAVMDYLRARLVYMTYAFADLQTILVNRRTSFPSLAVEKTASFKVFAARIVRRNLSLGSPQLTPPDKFWISSFETTSFAYSCWRISSSAILAIQSAMDKFGSIKGYESTPILDLLEALLDFENVKKSKTNSPMISNNPLIMANKEIKPEVLANISESIHEGKELSKTRAQDQYNKESKDQIQVDLSQTDSMEIENISRTHEISNKVNEYFTKCYTGKMSIPELTNELKRLHSVSNDSTNDNRIFNLFLQTLFDECRSFPKYPLPELKITAEILGMLVREDLLISYGNALVFVLRCIIEALRKNHWTKMFCFGILAMEQFIERFVSFPQFLSAIINMSQHLKPAIESYVYYCESCISLIPENFRNKLYLEKSTLESLNVLPHSIPRNLVSRIRPEMIAFGSSIEEFDQSNKLDEHQSQKAKIGNLITLDLSGKKTLPNGLTIEQLQGFGLGSLERLMNDPLICSTLITPSEQVIEHIFTICNTLAITNIDSKANEMAEILNSHPEYCPWFAFYLVKNRASKEKNNHSTYVSLLIKLEKLLLEEPVKDFTGIVNKEDLGVPLIHKDNRNGNKRDIIGVVTLASYDCIKALLCYSSILNDVSSFVNVLRHLGYWLGQITIGIDRPIIHKYINPRQLLIESYSKGCIASILPFICKILENAKNTYFRPPNPWTNNLLFTLAEIHSLSNNTNSNMFEVELLFKQLELNLEEYTNKTNFLGINMQRSSINEQLNVTDNRQRVFYSTGKISHDANYNLSGMNSADRSNTNLNNLLTPSPNLYHISFNNIGDSQLVSTFMPPTHTNPVIIQQSNQHQISSTDIQFWANKVLISPSVALFQIQPSLRPLVPLALDRSIKEILQVVIPRSVRIAALTTREIIGKEFAFEPDENVYKRAAHLMVAALSGSMAIAACREPLRVAFTAQLRQVLHPTPREGEDHVLIEQVVQVLCSDNIDLGCQIIEQAVVEKAIEELDEIISPGILARRKSRESGHQFVDTNYYGGPNTQTAAAYWASLPEMLKYRHNSMRHLQLYKDFLQFTLMRNLERRDHSLQSDTQNIHSSQPMISVYQQGNNEQFNNQLQLQNQHWNNSNAQYSHQEMVQNSSSIRNDGNNSQLITPNNTTNTTNVTTAPVVQPPEPVRVPLVFELAYLPLMMRVDECLNQIKDVIREIALYPPIFSKHFFPPVIRNNGENLYQNNHPVCSKPLGSNISFNTPKSVAHPVLSVLGSLSSDHVLFYLCKVIYTIGISSSHREDVLIGIAQKLYKTLFDAGAAYQQSTTGVLPSTRCIASSLGFDAALLHIEVFLGLCNQMSFFNTKFWSKIRKEAIGWFIYTMEDPKYSVDIVVGALRYDLIPSNELDLSLSNLIDTAVSLINDSSSASGSNNRGVRIVEFVYKLFFRSIEDWHYPITKKLPNTTQVLMNRLSNNCSFIQNSNLLTTPIVLPGLYYKPYPSTTNLNELKNRVEGLLMELNEFNSSLFHDQWTGEKVPEILNFNTIIQNNNDTILNPKYVALPIPITPSPDVVKGINMIFDEWILLLRITIFSGVGGTERNNPYRNLFLQRLSRQGLLRMDDTTEKLFTVCIERAIYLSLNNKFGDSSNQDNRSKLFNSETNENSSTNMDPFPIDSLVRLITTMARYVDPQQMAAVVITHKFLSILTRIIHRDAESSSFNQRPYYRVFYALLQEYENIGFNTEMIHFTCILSIVHHLQYVNPNRVPGFTYSWIQIVSSNRFFPYLLRHVKGWQPYQALLMQLFTFISPYLKSVQLSNNIKTIYGALLRILLVLLHDFPEFLCDYSCSFCDVLPVNCIQIRNLILSAFPRNMKLPDPFLPTLKIENLPEMKIIPRMIANYGSFILFKDLKTNIDKYWLTRDSSVLPTISETLKLPREEALKFGTKYSSPIITGLLLYIGIYLPNGNNSISNDNTTHRNFNSTSNINLIDNSSKFEDLNAANKQVSLDSIDDPSLAIILFLCRDLDMEGRFVLISAITNFLGYPNSYTFYFSSLILWLFSNSQDSIVQEQITRILLERLIVHRPHPWGLLITFIELIKNPKYSFWNCSFVHLAPEVEKLFQSVAQTCLGQGQSKTSSVNSSN